MSFFISILLSFSWGKEPTTSAMDAFNKGVFHLLDSDPSANPELAIHYFTAELPNTLRTSSESNFFDKTGLEPQVILKWGKHYELKGRYINAIRLAFVLVQLNHPQKHVYVPKLLAKGLRDNDQNSLFFMALYHYRQPYGIQSIKNARDLLLQILGNNQVPKEAMLTLVNRDIQLFQDLPKLSFRWTSGVIEETVSLDRCKLKRVSFTKQTLALAFGLQEILLKNSAAARHRFKNALDQIDPERAYAFLDVAQVTYTDEEKALILAVVATQPDHKDYEKVLYRLALICLYQPFDLDFGFQSLGVRLLEFLQSRGNQGIGDLNLYRYRSYLPGLDSSSFNLIDPAIQKLLLWERGLLTNS